MSMIGKIINAVDRLRETWETKSPVLLTFTGGINPHGAYDNAHAYITGDSVYYTDGCSYVARQASTGNLPTNTAYWQKLSDKGATGAVGVAGADGITYTWRSGAGAPAGGLGINGDFYLNTTNGDVYLKTAGTWAVVINIIGADGANGVNAGVLMNGAGAPAVGLGVDNDYYINLTNGDLYYKSGGAWAVVANITGPTGGFVICTGAEINTGTDNAKGATPKAIADSDIAFLADIPDKATDAEINTGTDDAKFATPKAIADSKLNLKNSHFCKVKLTADQIVLANAVSGFRMELDTIVTDLGNDYLIQDWYGASGAFEQANASGCTSTNIQRKAGSVNYPGGLLYCLVEWASTSNGVTNYGKGYITAVTDISNLAIAKLSGTDFANNYYYRIRKFGYLVPITGTYSVSQSCRIITTEDQKRYNIEVIDDAFPLPIALTSNSLCASGTGTLVLPSSAVIHLVAGQLITHRMKTYSLAGNPTLTYVENQNYFSIMLLKSD